MTDILRQLDSVPAFLFYWFPLMICAVGYTTRTIRNYQIDQQRRSENSYIPTDDVAALLRRIAGTIIPGINIVLAILDVAPEIFPSISRMVNRPLVPRRPR